MNIADYVMNAVAQLNQRQTQPQGNSIFPGLELLNQIDSQEPMLPIPVQQPMGGPDTSGIQGYVGSMLKNQPPVVPTKQISNHIQQQTGAKPAQPQTLPQQILSNRFAQNDTGPSFGDYATAIQKSAYGTPTGAQEVADANAGNSVKAMLAMQKLQSGGIGGATGELVQRYMDATGLPFDQALYQVQTGFRKGQQLDANGNIVNMPGAVNAANEAAGGKKTAEETAKINVERSANLSKAQAALVGLEQQTNIVTDNIDKALKLVQKPYSAATGYSRSLGAFGAAPNSDARALDNYLATIKSNLGFDKLQQMRENSPTGGALGQVSDFENKLLQAVNGALDPLQKDQLVQNLQSIKELYPKVLEERKRAFQQDYGGLQPINGAQQPDINDPGFQQFLRNKGLM